MSTLAVNALQAQTGTTVSLPTGHKIVGTDAASIVAPGHIIQQVYSIIMKYANHNNISLHI